MKEIMFLALALCVGYVANSREDGRCDCGGKLTSLPSALQRKSNATPVVATAKFREAEMPTIHVVFVTAKASTRSGHPATSALRVATST